MVFKKLGIASDHAGKDLKKTVYEFLVEQGIEGLPQFAGEFFAQGVHLGAGVIEGDDQHAVDHFVVDGFVVGGGFFRRADVLCSGGHGAPQGSAKGEESELRVFQQDGGALAPGGAAGDRASTDEVVL